MKAPSATTLVRARRLRRDQSDAEKRLCMRLRGGQVAGAKFRRQHPIGPFVADFCCIEYGLVIELDGGQHAEHAAADAERTAFLETQGYGVLRFWNNEVLANLDAVLERIGTALRQRPRWGPTPAARK